MKVAIVHDDLIQWGGAERVLLGISEIFPDAPIYTLVFDDKNPNLNPFKDKKIITSFIQKIPGWRAVFKATLPLHPIAFEQFDFSDFDLVISQTTRFAKSVVTKPGTKHVCYCHTPPRFLWNFSSKDSKFDNPYFKYLRKYDLISSKRVDLYLAGSKNAKKRIKDIYSAESEILLPFVENSTLDSFDGGYYLLIARLNHYKRAELAVEAFKGSNKRLKIVGSGPELGNLMRQATANIEFLGSVSDQVRDYLISGCLGLIVTAEEDFGLTPLEAQSFGKGVIAYRGGGVLETVTEETGVFFDKQDGASLKEALSVFEKKRIDPMKCRENAGKFSKDKFQKRLLDLTL